MDFGNFFREESGEVGEQLSLQFNNIRIERWRVDRIRPLFSYDLLQTRSRAEHRVCPLVTGCGIGRNTQMKNIHLR